MPATTYALNVSPSSGPAGLAFVVGVTPDAAFTGTITVSHSGGGLSPGSATFTYNNSGGTSSTTVIPLAAGSVTLTGSNNAGLADPAPATYASTPPLAAAKFRRGLWGRRRFV